MFTIGSTVRLRSGGPTLTVVSSVPTECEVAYFDTGSFRRERFPNAALALISTAKPVLAFDGDHVSVHLVDGTTISEKEIAGSSLGVQKPLPIELEIIAEAPDADSRLRDTLCVIQAGVQKSKDARL